MGCLKIVVVLCSLCGIVSASNVQLFKDVFWKEASNASDASHEQLSMRCLSQMVRIFLDPDSAVKMFDSSTKIPEGVFNGRLHHLGNYEECLGIESKQNFFEPIYGKYCVGTIPVSSVSLTVSICIPNQCSPEEVVNLMGLNFTRFDHDYCQSKDQVKEISSGALFTIIFLSIVLVIALFSTILDVFLHYSETKSPHPLLTAFSALSNFRKIVRPSKDPDQLLCLNGVKAISMMWVIVGHQFSSLAAGVPVANMLIFKTFLEDPASMYVIGATLSVDTFFLVAGLVTVYTVLRHRDRGVRFNVPMYYLHRYIRLTPALAVVVLVYATLMEYIGDGPLWPTVEKLFLDPCKTDWWNTLFYIQNFAMPEKVCINQSWYLSVDMQLFLLSPLVLIPLMKWPRHTLYGMFALVGLGIAIPFILTWAYDLVAFSIFTTFEKVRAYETIYYLQTSARFAPYVIGMIDGYIIYSLKNDQIALPFSKFQATCLWIVSLAGMTACVFAGSTLLNSEPSQVSNSFFNALNRPAWSLCVSFIIIACIGGYAGPVDKFLSLPIFQFLTKLSYSMYLTHTIVIMLTLGTWREAISVSNSLLMYIYWGTFVYTLGLSLILCLLFESPIIIIEKAIFSSGSGRSRNKLTIEQQESHA